MSEALRGIGASRVPAIAGASPWSTPVGVWMEMVGLAPARAQTAAMAAGLAMEGPILRMAAEELGQPIRRNRKSFPHPQYPVVPLWATPDGFGPRRRFMVEAKYVAHRFGDWSDGVPAYVNLQVQSQLACLPRTENAVVAALVSGDLRTFRVDRDPAIQDQLPELVASWYETHIRQERAPEPVTPDDRWSLLRLKAAAESGRLERHVDDDEAQTAAELLVLMRHADEVAEQVDARRMRLAEAAVESDLVGDGFRARWGERSSTDWTSLMEELRVPPATVERFTRRSRVFTFRRIKHDANGEEPARIDITTLVPSGVFR